jgi:hypothetical protein
MLAPGTPAVQLAFDGLAPLAITNGRLEASLLLAPGTPAVRDAVDGLAPLAVTNGRLEAPLLLAPGTPAVRDAFDGPAPLAVTFSRRPAALMLAARPRTSTLHLWRHLLLQWPFEVHWYFNICTLVYTSLLDLLGIS